MGEVARPLVHLIQLRVQAGHLPVQVCDPGACSSQNLSGAVDVESAYWIRKGRRSASAGMSCRLLSCLITRLGNMRVLPKWLRRGTPTIPGHPVIMGPPGFHRATHKNRAGVNSRQKRLHSEKLCSGGASSVPWKWNTACSGSQNSAAVLKKIQSTGVSVSITTSPMMPRMNAWSTGRRVLQMRMMSCLGGMIASSLRPGAGRMTVPVYACFSVLLGESLTRDGGSRLKGVNSLKLGEDLWGPVRWHSRLDPFPYSEPPTNLASYIGARGMSDKISGKRRKAVNKQVSKQTGLSPNPLDVPSGVAKLCAPEFNLVGARMRSPK
ncbi:hypothetical protein CRG98_034917 [Punica granatum]|uniref:Uncharacterized protein n=1 Tax=Punica granatum TaxID=22663 RepID=A0A2I0IL21_PUNGR|nr:hypothetical protein CRG98_034917 [Punica granatum]